MKRLTLISIAVLMQISLLAQVQWIKYASNSVLTKGPTNMDSIAVGQPSCLIENDTIKMWYAGVGVDMKARICYAYSTDGITWIKHNNYVLDVGNPGEWDCGWLDTPEIVKINNTYKLYYYGDTTQQSPEISSSIGVAYSTDGINWTKEASNPVFSKGVFGEWDGSWVESPAILYNDTSGVYSMWYNGVDTATWKLQIGLATSSDGISWTRYAANPVVSVGNWGDYDDIWLGTPAVIRKSGIYEMWYSSASTQSYDTITEKFDTIGICFAYSTDGINWTKHANNPLFNTYTTPYDSVIDDGGPWAADVIYDINNDEYKMWFETFNGFSLATSPNINVEIENKLQLNNNLIIYPNPFQNSTTIEFDNPTYERHTINIYNYTGERVKSINNIYSNKVVLNMENFSSGMYFIELRNNQKIIAIGKVILN